MIINGVDLTDTNTPEDASLSCRVYTGGLPTIDAILKKIYSIIEND